MTRGPERVVQERDGREGSSPLEGRVVIVTRPREQADELASMLRARGAQPLVAPTIELAPSHSERFDRALEELAAGRFAWVVFTSRAGVEAVLRRLAHLGFSDRDVRAKAAAVGDGTATALRARGIEPSLVPRRFTTAALGDAMPRGAGPVLLPRADIAPAGLEAALESKGWSPVRVDAYRTRLAPGLDEEIRLALDEGRVDAITFTSASTVRAFLRLAGRVSGPKIACIGPVTARAAREGGLEVATIARPHTIDGLVDALEAAFGGGSPRRLLT